MKPLFTESEFNFANSSDLLPIECLVCGKTFYKTKHYIKSHILNPNSQATGNVCSIKCANAKRKKETIKKTCPKCGSVFETVTGKEERKFCSSFCSHSRKQTEETKKKISEIIKKSEKAHLANLKRKMNPENRIEKTCPICKKNFIVPKCYEKRIYCSKDCYNKDYKLEYRKYASGGLREGSGRSKSGWYKGYYCGSSYELAWVIYNIDHKIKFERNYEGFDYIFEGEEHKYYPDFIQGDVYYEIKGFKRKNDEAKFKYFPYKLKVLFKKDLKKVFKYVIKNYGKDFIKLYEGNPYNEKNNVCLICGKPAKNMYCSQECSGRAANRIQYHNSIY